MKVEPVQANESDVAVEFDFAIAAVVDVGDFVAADAFVGVGDVIDSTALVDVIVVVDLKAAGDGETADFEVAVCSFVAAAFQFD